MLTLNRILVATDFSASADSALRLAAALARQSQAGLLAMHVVETGMRALPRWTDIFRATEVLADQEAASQAALDQVMSHPALQGVDAERLIQYGEPVDRISDIAAQVDLVVIGMGAPGGNSGGIARELAHSSATPVLLVPPGGGTASLPADGDDHVVFKQILLAVDLAGYAPQAVELATAVAADQQAPLLALQILDPKKAGHYPVDPGVGLHHNVDGLRALLEKRLAEAVPTDAEGAPLIRRVLDGEVDVVLQQQIAEHRADLVVMSVHEYGTVRRLFTQSTLDAVLAQGVCPVLAVPFPRLVGG